MKVLVDTNIMLEVILQREAMKESCDYLLTFNVFR